MLSALATVCLVMVSLTSFLFKIIIIIIIIGDGGGREGAEGERVEKKEERLDLDICPGASEFLVKPLPIPPPLLVF